MPNFYYEKWWLLHLRVAQGESLSDQDASTYVLGLTQLDEQHERADDSFTYLQALRTTVQRATVLHQELTARSAALDNKITILESAYQQQTDQVLDLGSHAPHFRA